MVVALAAGCGQSAGPTPATTAPTAATSPSPVALAPVDPERIKRVRGDLPADYEVADITGPASLSGFWGFRVGWTAEPTQCAALVESAADPAPQVRGLSGSGAGGIVYVVVQTPSSGAYVFDPALVDQCAQWTMAYGRSSASVSFVDAPPIDGAATVGMVTAIRTVVESGTETDAQADTFSAYVDGHFVFVTVVTDPGLPAPPLPPQFAAELLVKTVSALRGR